MEGILILVTIFQYVLGLIVAHLFGWNESLVLRFLAVACLLFSIFEFFANWRDIRTTRKTNRVIGFMFLYTFILASSIPVNLVNGDSSLVSSEILSFGTRALSGMLMAFWLSSEKYETKVVKWTIPLAIFLTVSLFIVALKNRANAGQPNSAQLMEIDRQTVSYGGAYAIGLVLLSKCGDLRRYTFRLFRGFAWKLFSWAIIAIDFYVILSGEGRGAFVLTGVIFILFGLYRISVKGFTPTTIARGLLFFSAIALGAYLLFSFSGKGNNILALLQNGFTDRSSSGRLDLYQKAFEAAQNRFFIGLGATSIVYDVGFYSHNIFVDILCDFGIAGVLVFTVFLVRALMMAYRTQKVYFSHFAVFIFCFGFTMLLFSGSWMSDSMLWFGIPSLLLLNGNNATKKNALVGYGREKSFA